MDQRTRQLLTVLDTAGPSLHALLLKLTLRPEVAEDLMQELFLRLSQAEGFVKADQPVAFAKQVATNLAMDWWRARKRRPEAAGLPTEVAADQPSVLRRLIEAEDLERILAVLPELGELSRTALILRYIQGQDFEEIGRALGRTAHQARALCHKAVRQVRLALNPPRACPEESSCGEV